MSEKSYFTIDTSILFRANQRYFDDVLAKYGLGYAQLIFLIEIYEHEGIAMNALAEGAYFDKGSVTKSIQKLEESGYVEVEVSSEDRRVKKLYTTAKTQEIILKLYAIRQERWNYLSQDLSAQEKQAFIEANAAICKRAKEYEGLHMVDSEMKFYGFQKCTLLDYPGKVASTLFTGGCNFRCPFCHNRDLVFLDEGASPLDLDYLEEFFKKRRKLLDGVCITGGEPLLNRHLKTFMRRLKDMGYLIKLDTNGSYFNALKALIEEGLIDYVAMDIKNTKEKYPLTVGVDNVDMTAIDQSIDYLLKGNIDYEFRTTLVKEFHDISDVAKIAQRIKGAKAYYLQNFVDRDKVIQKGLHPLSHEELIKAKKAALPYVENTQIRGEE